MKSHRFLRVTLPLAALALALPVSAQTVRGRIVDAGTGEAVPGARVEALTARGNAARARTLSAEDGRFELALRAAGAYRLRAAGLGYAPTTSQVLEVGERDTVVVDVRVSSEPLRVDPLIVTARQRPPEVRALRDRGFYERKREGFGRFMERDEIARFGTNSISEIMDRMPGTRRVGKSIIFPRSELAGAMRRSQRGGQGPCPPELYVDGILVSVDPREGMDGVVQPSNVEAIELFSSPSNIPVQWSGSTAACGVILLWTRSGGGVGR